MISNNHILKILLAFLSGIILAKYTRIDWILAFTIWSFILMSLLLFVFFGRNSYSYRRIIGFGILLVFFSSGILGLASTLRKNIDNHYYKLFLPKDNLIGTVVEFEKGSKGYNKVIFEVDYVANAFREKSVEGKFLSYIDNEIPNVHLGNKLIISPNLFPIENKNNPGEFDAASYWESQGITEITFLKS